jgi:hypothetical protein
MRPLAIDLFTGLHGWAEGLIAAGWHVIGFDLEDMSKLLGEAKPEHFSFVIQDVLTLHGAQFKDAELIVASPPCQFFSYTAMPWSRAKALAAAVRADPARLEKELALFRACFRIRREASEAAGRFIPLVVENVRGAIPWVGRSAWNFGSYHLWADVPALMPMTKSAKVPGMGAGWVGPEHPKHKPGLAFNPAAQGARVRAELAEAGLKRTGRTMCYPEGSANPAAVKGCTGKLHWQDEAKLPGFRFDGSGRSFQSASVEEHSKGGGDWFGSGADCSLQRWQASKSLARKAASAKIAKIPLTLSTWIGKCWLPVERQAA